MCVKSPARFGERLGASGFRLYMVMLDWHEFKPFFRLLSQPPPFKPPYLMLIRCVACGYHSARAVRSQAHSWLQRQDLPLGLRYRLCSGFDISDGVVLGAIDLLADLDAAAVDGRSRSADAGLGRDVPEPPPAVPPQLRRAPQLGREAEYLALERLHWEGGGEAVSSVSGSVCASSPWPCGEQAQITAPHEPAALAGTGAGGEEDTVAAQQPPLPRRMRAVIGIGEDFFE